MPLHVVLYCVHAVPHEAVHSHTAESVAPGRHGTTQGSLFIYVESACVAENGARTREVGAYTCQCMARQPNPGSQRLLDHADQQAGDTPDGADESEPTLKCCCAPTATASASMQTAAAMIEHVISLS